jgi:autotransporter-associated beta strand protein
MTCLMFWASFPSHLLAVNYSWDGGNGNWGDSNWNTGSNWADGAESVAVFGVNPGTITLVAPVTAGGMRFNGGGFVIDGAVVTLEAPSGSVSPVLAVTNNGFGTNRVTIASVLAGTEGFVKVGNGTLVLTGANTISGDVAIRGGNLVIGSTNNLGVGTTAISVTGLAQAGNPGYSGGALVLQGNAAAAGNGMTLNREVSVAGRGPGAVNSTGGLLSVGYNTVAGGLTIGGPGGIESRVWATHGSTTVSGNVFLASGAGSFFGGNGNWIISGEVGGNDNVNDRFVKTGAIVGSTLWLQNPNNSFLQAPRVDSGTIRVNTAGALGSYLGTLSIDIQNGSFELRTDAPADFASRNVIQRTNTSGNIFLDHDTTGPLGISTGLQGQTVQLGTLRSNLGSGQTATFAINGRNGFGAVFNPTAAGGAVHGGAGAGDGNMTINVNANGPVVFNGNMQFINTGTGTTARNLSFGGNGDVTVNGNYIPLGTPTHGLVKNGTGTFTFNSSASTHTGLTTINAGTLAFSNGGAFANSSQINLASAALGGRLAYIGAGETLSKTINLNSTTGPAFLFANQIGATGPLVISSNLTASGAGAKTLVLGGSNQLANEIGGNIVNNSGTNTTSLLKTGTGFWTLSGANTYTGTTTINNGTLVLKATASGVTDIVNGTGAVIFNADGIIGLAGHQGTQSAGGILRFDGFTGGSQEALGALTATAGHGQVVIGGDTTGSTLTFASLAARTPGATLNLAPGGTSEIIFTAATTNAAGIIGGYATFGVNGTDFAANVGAGGSASAYTSASTLVPAAVVGTNYQLTSGTVALNAGVSMNSLKLVGSADPTTVTLNGINPVATGGILFDNTGGTVETPFNALITGGTQIGAATTELIVTTNGTGVGALTIGSGISSGAGSLTKSGTGTLILSGATAFTGNVNINQGTVQLSGATARIGTAQAAATVFNLRQGATFDLNGAGGGSTTIGALNGAGTIMNSGTSTLIIGNGATTTVGNAAFTGLIQSAGLSLTKEGTGVQYLTGANTYGGVTTINRGVLAVTSLANGLVPSSIGESSSAASNLVFNNGGILRYTGSDLIVALPTGTPSVSTNREFTLAGNGTIQSSGTYGNSFLVAGAQNNASLIFSSTADISFSGATGARLLTLGGTSSGDNEMRIRLANNDIPSAGFNVLSLTKADAGLWILNPLTSNTYSGDTTISAGVLRAMTTGSVVGISNNSLLTINGGVLETSGVFSRTLGNTTGTNQVRLTGGNSGFAAATPDRLVVNIGGGALTWGSANFAPSSLVLGSGTALGETEIANDINLGTASRTVTTNVNGTTGTMVTAGILSGVISGGAGGNLNKNGAGVLMLGNANTHIGNTVVQNGTLMLGSLGNATGTTASSLGASGGALQLNGNATVQVIYTGEGEVSTRPVRLATALSAARIHRIDASGSGALVLDNFQNTSTGNFAMLFELRGANTDNNRINSVIGDGVGSLNLLKGDGGVWILGNSNNTFTGGVRVDGGLLGLVSNGATGAPGFMASSTAATSNAATVTVASTAGLKPGMWVHGAGVGYGDYIVSITNGTQFVISANRTIASGAQLQFGGIGMSNGGIFAADGNALTLSQPITLNNNAAAVFAGAGNITLNGALQMAAGNNPITISNNLENGAVLTIDGPFFNYKAHDQVLQFRGFSDTVLNSTITNAFNGTNTTSLSIATASNSIFTIGGASPNTHSGTTTFSNGILNIGKVGAFGTGNFDVAGGTVQAAIDLTGANRITNATRFTGSPSRFSGTNSIELGGTTVLTASRNVENNLSGGAQLIISGGITNTAASTLTLYGSGDTLINSAYNAGTGANGLQMSGTGTVTITGAAAATGTLTASRGTISLEGAAGAWGAGNVTLNTNGLLRLDNSVTNNNNRLFDTGVITMQGGTLELIGNNTTETAGPMTVNGIMGQILMTGSGTNTLSFGTVNFANSGSSLDLSSISGLGSTNRVLFSAVQVATTAWTNPILPRTLINGDFARYDTTNGVVPFTAYNSTNDFDAALATDTMSVTGPITLTANRTLNAIRIAGSGLNVGTANRNLTLTAGALLNTGGNNTFNGGTISFAQQGWIQVDAGTTLNLNAAVIGNTINKVGAGTLSLDTLTYHNTTTNISGGTLVLNAGLNTLFAAANAVPGTLILDQGATLDLNGNNQYVGALTNTGAGLNGSAGTIMSSTGSPLFVFRDGSTFSGNINGSINLGRIGGGTHVFNGPLGFTGGLTLMGGITRLSDDATLLNISSLDINYGTLELHNNANFQIQNGNRIDDSLPITLRGGAIIFNGRVSTLATETLGAVTALEGVNTIAANTGGGTVTGADLTLASLTRSQGAIVNFTGSNLGQLGNNARIVFTTPLSTVGGGALGAWAIANSSDYAAYNTGTGVGVVGQGGFAGYAPNFGSGLITNLAASANRTTLLPSGGATTGMLRFSNAFNNSLEFTNPDDVLNLELGGLLRSNEAGATSIGTPSTRGVITSGTSELIVFNQQNTVTINSVIQGATQLVKGGAGALTLTAGNTYSGGTLFQQGAINLSPTITDGSITVIPAGGLTINGGATNSGTLVNVNASNAIAASNDLVINGRGSVTYGAAALSNGLNSITFNNIGGEANPTITLPANGFLTLGSSTPITATSSNAATTATITGGTVVLASGVNTISVDAIRVGPQIYSGNQATLNIASALAGGSSSVVKIGDGLLQVGGQSTFTGGISVSAGGLVLGGSSTNTSSGPLGIGTTSFASGTSLWVDNNDRTVFNDMVFSGDPVFNNIGTTTRTLTLNGDMTFGNLAGSGAVINIPTPFLNVILGGNIAGIGSVTAIGGTGPNTISKSGLGNITGINLAGLNPTATINVSALTTGAFSLLTDANGNVNPATQTFGDVTVSGIPNLIIGRTGFDFAPVYPLAVNKTLVPNSLSSANNGLILTNNHGYGLLLNDAIALNGTTAPTYNVSIASASNGVQGLTLDGVISGGISGDVALIKSGAGTLVLANAGNTFGSTGSIIDVTAGLLQVSSNGALGDSANVVRISTNNATQGLRLAGGNSYTLTGRVIRLNAASSGIDVTGGTVVTLDTPFSYSSAANNLQKNDNGTLILSADNTGWTGTTTINGGFLQVADSNALGSGGVALTSTQGSAFQLTGGQTISSPINLNAGTANLTVGGVNFGGQLDNLAGTNTWSGAVTTSWDAAIGARAGTTLNLTGGISMATSAARAIIFNAAGDINISGTALTNGSASSWHRLEKWGAGTLDLTTANTGLTFSGSTNGAAVSVLGGTLRLSGAGTFNTAAWSTNSLFVNNATLQLDNVGTNVLQRTTNNTPASARALNLATGTLDFLVNGAAASAETFGALTSSWGRNRVRVTTTGQNSTLTFASLVLNGGSILSFESAGTGANFGTAGNNVFFSTAPALTNGILARGIVIDGNGVNFATHGGNGTSITGYAAYNNSAAYTDIDSAAATDNVRVGTGFVTTTALTASRTINSLYLSGGGVDVTAPANTVLTVSSGGILANGGISTLGNSGMVVAAGSTEFGISVAAGSTLNVAGMLTNANNVTKGLDGTLQFNTRQRFNTGTNYFTVAGGSVILNGGSSTLFPGVQGGTFGQGLAIAPGATLDLNGNSQMVGRFRNANNSSVPGAGGIVTSVSPAVFVSVTTGEDSNWGGGIQGALSFVKAGSNTQNVRSLNNYTGETLVTGGGLTLVDNGRLSNTTAIAVHYGTLSLANNGLFGEDDRINDAATITLRGGSLSMTGRDNTQSVETVGNIVLDQGQNNLTVTLGGGNIRSAVLTTGDLTRNNFSTLLFGGASGQLGSASRLIINNGTSLLVNGIIPWATDGTNFAGYETPSVGNTSGGLASIAGAGYRGYDGTLLPAGAGSATSNIRLSSASFVVPSDVVGPNTYNLNALSFGASAANQSLSFADSADILNLGSGGFIVSGNFTGKTIGSAVGNGSVTAGGTQSSGIAPLYFTVNQGTVNFNSSIVDNGNGAATRFVYTPFNAAVTTFFGANSYTGGTQLNGNISHTGTIALNVAGADGGATVAIPAGDLILNGATVRLDGSNQIHNSVVPTLNGAGVLNLNGFSQTLGGLVFNNNGSSTVSTVTIGAGVLTLNGDIIATSSNAGAISTITRTGAGNLNLNGAQRTFDIAPVTLLGDTGVAYLTPTLNITALITGDASSGINKIGNGILQLGAANTYGGATDLSAGTIRYGIANALPATTAVTMGATATLDLNGFNATIGSLAGAAGAVVINSAFTGSNTLIVGGDNLSTVYGGVLSNAFGSTLNLTKAGTGTLTLTGAGSNFLGRTIIQNGALSTPSINSVVGGSLTSGLGAPITVANGTIDLGATTNTGTLIYTGAGETTDRIFNLAGTTGGGGISSSGTGALIVTNPLTITGVGNKTLTLGGSNTDDNTLVAPILNGAGSTISLAKEGTGKWLLGVSNSYGGSTTINGGLLQLVSGSPVSIIPDRSAVILADVAGAVLDLNGNSETIGSLAGGGTTGGNVNLTGTGSLTLGLDNLDASFLGNITGASTGGLTKVGSGMQTLGGVNTFTGNVLIGNIGGQSGGGLTLAGGSALADSVNVRNAGWNTVFGITTSETISRLSGSNNTSLVLGTGATLTTSYTNGTPVVMAAAADSAAANGRVIKDIDTSNLTVGMLISGTGVSAPGYIVQILNGNSVLVNRTPPTGPTNNFAPTVTSVSVLGSAMSGEGGFTKNGGGLVILTGNSTHSGATTINEGTVQVGGIWTGQRFAINDVLSNQSRITFGSSGSQELRFADSTNNLLSFARIGSLAGGVGNTTSVFLESGSNRAILALGGDNSDSTFTGRIMGGGGAETMVIKEGTGNFTWINADSNVFDGPVYIENGTVTIGGSQGFDGSNEVWMSNRGSTLTVTTTGGETIPFLVGGAGATRGAMPTSTSGGTASAGWVGATPGNFLTSVAPVVNLTTNLTLNEALATSQFSFNGDIRGASIFSKGGAHQLNLTGVSSNLHTGETQVTAGTLRMGILGAATGVGTPELEGQNGTLSTATALRLTGGVLDLNGTTQTVTRINASSTGGTIQLLNGTLNLTAQNSQAVGTVFTGNLNSVINLTGSAAGRR